MHTSIGSSLLVCTHLFLTEHNIITDSFKSKPVQINTKLNWEPYLGFNQTVSEYSSLLLTLKMTSKAYLSEDP